MMLISMKRFVYANINPNIARSKLKFHYRGKNNVIIRDKLMQEVHRPTVGSLESICTRMAATSAAS